MLMPRDHPEEASLRKRPPAWGWTLAVVAVFAALIALAGSHLARQTESVAEKPPGNRSDDAFREVARRIEALERLWENALDAEADRLLSRNFHSGPSAVVGVVQRSLLNPSLSDPGRAHVREDGQPPQWRPMLEKFSRKEAGEWVFSERDILHGSGWIEMPGKPPAWWRGNGRMAVILLVDPAEAASVAAADLRAKAPSLSGEAGAFVWRAPSGVAWAEHGERTHKPDEILRHVSRFGDWTLERHYPVRVEVTWRMPVLAGSFALALLLLAGGIAVAVWQRKAIRLAEERVSFVNRVSHELRTPLTNLLLNTDLALDGLPVEDGRLRRRLGLIREETGRLSRIVDNVLAFARIERGRYEARGQSCDLGALIDEMRENFAPLFERKSIRCRYEHDGGGSVPLDRDALAQILANLLSNVEKYAGESAEARVAVSMNGERLVVEVADDGPGIPAEARDRVFRPFERAGSRVNEGATGTGLGLTISRELARGLGGRLELVPSPGGARFRLEIPMERNPA